MADVARLQLQERAEGVEAGDFAGATVVPLRYQRANRFFDLTFDPDHEGPTCSLGENEKIGLRVAATGSQIRLPLKVALRQDGTAKIRASVQRRSHGIGKPLGR